MLQLNDRRVIQLSTAVRSISKSPYIVKDFLKIERAKWNLGLFHFLLNINLKQETGNKKSYNSLGCDFKLF